MNYLGVGWGRMRKKEDKKPQERRSHELIVSCSTNIFFTLAERLRCCVSFCRVMYVHISPPLRQSLPLPPSHASRLPQFPTELPVLYSWFPLAICFVQWQCIYVSPHLPVYPPPPLPNHVCSTILDICIAIPALKIGSPVPFF